MKRLVDGQEQVAITTLGGSASTSQDNYAYYLKQELCTEIPDCDKLVLFNPSQGTTSTVWASLFMRSLIPKTDILIWLLICEVLLW